MVAAMRDRLSYLGALTEDPAAYAARVAATYEQIGVERATVDDFLAAREQAYG